MHLTCITTQEMRFCKIVCLFYYMRYLEKILMSSDMLNAVYNGGQGLFFLLKYKNIWITCSQNTWPFLYFIPIDS